MEKKLSFDEGLNAFVVPIEEIELANLRNLHLRLVLGEENYKRLGCKAPSDKAPAIGFLLAVDGNNYTLPRNYAKAIANAGAEIVCLDYDNYEKQIMECDGLVLPGGRFEFPERYYSVSLNEDYPNKRSRAYADLLWKALEYGMPILGICAGAQVVVGEFCGVLGNDVKKATRFNHQTEQMHAHVVNISKGNVLYDLLKCDAIMTNSRHNEYLLDVPVNIQLEIYAKSEDGIPEAWGSEKDRILCVQWHPEDYAVSGDARQQRLFDWLVREADEPQD